MVAPMHRVVVTGMGALSALGGIEVVSAGVDAWFSVSGQDDLPLALLVYDAEGRELAREAGANVLVAGHAVFHGEDSDYRKNIDALRGGAVVPLKRGKQ